MYYTNALTYLVFAFEPKGTCELGQLMRDIRRHNRTSTVANKWHVVVQSDGNLPEQTTYVSQIRTHVSNSKKRIAPCEDMFFFEIRVSVDKTRVARVVDRAGRGSATDKKIVADRVPNACVRTRAHTVPRPSKLDELNT